MRPHPSAPLYLTCPACSHRQFLHPVRPIPPPSITASCLTHLPRRLLRRWLCVFSPTPGRVTLAFNMRPVAGVSVPEWTAMVDAWFTSARYRSTTRPTVADLLTYSVAWSWWLHPPAPTTPLVPDPRAYEVTSEPWQCPPSMLPWSWPNSPPPAPSLLAKYHSHDWMSPMIQLTDHPLSPSAIGRLLADHPDGGLLHMVALVGVPAAFEPPPGRAPLDFMPYSSALDAADAVNTWADDEVAAGRFTVLGPSLRPEHDGVTVDIHATGAVPKEVSKVRVVFDGTSFGASAERAANARCDRSTFRPLRLLLHDSIIASNTSINPDSSTALLASCIDLSSCYRFIPVSQRTRRLIAQRVPDGRTLLNNVLPFGLAHAGDVASKFSNAICDVVDAHGGLVSSFIDDFVVRGSHEQVQHTLRVLRSVVSQFGFRENVSKFRPPSSSQLILGIQYELDTHSVAVASDRRSKLLEDVRLAAVADITVGHVTSLVGKTRWLGTALPVYRALASLIARDLPSGARASDPRPLQLSSTSRVALSYAHALLAANTPYCYAPGHPDMTSAIHVFTDSHPVGIGVHCHALGIAISHRFPSPRTDVSNNFLEAAAAVLGLMAAVIDPASRDRPLFLYCDNLTAVHLLRGGTAADPRTHTLACCFTLLCYQRRVQIRHISGESNVVADRFSRGQPCPGLPLPGPLPDSLLTMLQLWSEERSLTASLVHSALRRLLASDLSFDGESSLNPLSLNSSMATMPEASAGSSCGGSQPSSRSQASKPQPSAATCLQHGGSSPSSPVHTPSTHPSSPCFSLALDRPTPHPTLDQQRLRMSSPVPPPSRPSRRSEQPSPSSTMAYQERASSPTPPVTHSIQRSTSRGPTSSSPPSRTAARPFSSSTSDAGRRCDGTTAPSRPLRPPAAHCAPSAPSPDCVTPRGGLATPAAPMTRSSSYCNGRHGRARGASSRLATSLQQSRQQQQTLASIQTIMGHTRFAPAQQKRQPTRAYRRTRSASAESGRLTASWPTFVRPPPVSVVSRRP